MLSKLALLLLIANSVQAASPFVKQQAKEAEFLDRRDLLKDVTSDSQKLSNNPKTFSINISKKNKTVQKSAPIEALVYEEPNVLFQFWNMITGKFLQQIENFLKILQKTTI